MNTETQDRLASAMDQAKAQYESIVHMVEDLRVAEEQDRDGGADETEAPRSRIEEDALSVEVRSDWQVAGGDKWVAEEYQILLCTGGPAVRIIGTLNEHCEPETARLECQDWFTPWTAWTGNCAAVEDVLLTYARCFYFGEG